MPAEAFYQVVAHPYTFNAIVKDEGDAYRIHFGDRTGCVFMSAQKYAAHARIDAIGHDKHCSIEVDEHLDNGCLEPGVGTEMLIKAAIQFAHDTFPFIQDFRLTDTSKIYCKGNVALPLAHHCLARFGLTWYQSKFHAAPRSKRVEERLSIGRQILAGRITMSFEAFFEMYIQVYDFKLAIAHLKDALKPLYDGSQTFYDFFAAVDHHYDSAFFDSWLKYFVDDVFGVPFDTTYWIISVAATSGWQRIRVSELEHRPIIIKESDLRYLDVNTVYMSETGGTFFPYGRRPAPTRKYLPITKSQTPWFRSQASSPASS